MAWVFRFTIALVAISATLLVATASVEAVRKFDEGVREKRKFHFTMPDADGIAPHPRLRVRDEKELISILNYTGNYKDAGVLLDQLYARAEKMLTEPPMPRPTPGPSGILTEVRTVLDRIYTMALLFRLTNNCNSTWYYRGWAELEAVARWSDWNPEHFLDVGEMTHAVAIGYDWFYKGLNETQKRLLEDALVEKGFKPAMAAFKEHAFWTYYDSNWNNVCNGGLIVGSLALLDDERYGGVAKEMLNISMHALPNSMASYAPDGAWPEGPGYWAYATDYTRFAISSLKTALGSDQGLGEFIGFNETADFNIHMEGTSLKNFNWADDRVGSLPAETAVSFYLASHYSRPEAAYLQRQKLLLRNGSVNDVIDYTPIGSAADLEKLPRVMLYKKREVLVARGSWTDRTAPFLGIKGGNVSYHHSHMDLGSFVLELKGVRFAIDLGSDNYGLPEYFGPKRFTYYRLRNVGHNTLTFDDDNQDEHGAAEIVDLEGTADKGQAVIDLSAAYAPSKVRSVRRSVAWSFEEGSGNVQITDDIERGSSEAVTVTWAMHTKAKVTISEQSFTLTEDEHTVTISMKSTDSECPYPELATNAVDLEPPQDSTKGVTRLTISAPARYCARIIVSIAGN